MTTRYFSTIVLASSLLGIPGSGPQRDCCRSLKEPVRYAEVRMDGYPPNDCDVVHVSSNAPDPIVTIRCPSGATNGVEGYLRRIELTTRNDGRNWAREPIDSPVPSLFPLIDSELVQAPSDTNVWYRRIEQVGLYLRSDDGGKTWSLPSHRIDGLSREEFAARQASNTAFYAVEFHLAAIDPNKPHVLYASIDLAPWGSLMWIAGKLSYVHLRGLFRSDDGGENWTKLSDAKFASVPIGLSASQPYVMYAQLTDGVKKSRDGGAAWDLIGEWPELAAAPMLRHGMGGEEFQLRISEFAVNPKDSETVYIVSNKGFYRSLDGGGTWCLLSLGFDDLSSAHSLVFNPANPDEIYLGTSRGVYHSKDQGCHFERIYPSAQ